MIRHTLFLVSSDSTIPRIGLPSLTFFTYSTREASHELDHELSLGPEDKLEEQALH